MNASNPEKRRTTRPRRVFISHTSELAALPVGRSFVSAARDAVLQAGDAVAEMTYFPATDRPPSAECEAAVRHSDVFVLVAGFRYGTPVRERPELSHVELEDTTATTYGLPRLVFLLGAATEGTYELFEQDDESRRRQDVFRTRLRNGGTTIATVCTPGELGNSVLQALFRLDADTPPTSSGTSWNVTLNNCSDVQVGEDNVMYVGDDHQNGVEPSPTTDDNAPQGDADDPPDPEAPHRGPDDAEP